MKRAYFEPFLLVVGTAGDENENALNLEIARSIAQRWWYRANGYTRIVRDKDVDASLASRYNLVLIGGPQSNLYSRLIADSVPFRIEEAGVYVEDIFIPGKDLACKFVYPNPQNPKKLILAEWGTSIEGLRLAGSLNCIYSGSGLPDFLVYDSAVRLSGYAGVRAAGFFDNSWRVNPDLSYFGVGIIRSSRSEPSD